MRAYLTQRAIILSVLGLVILVLAIHTLRHSIDIPYDQFTKPKNPTKPTYTTEEAEQAARLRSDRISWLTKGLRRGQGLQRFDEDVLRRRVGDLREKCRVDKDKWKNFYG